MGRGVWGGGRGEGGEEGGGGEGGLCQEMSQKTGVVQAVHHFWQFTVLPETRGDSHSAFTDSKVAIAVL